MVTLTAKCLVNVSHYLQLRKFYTAIIMYRYLLGCFINVFPYLDLEVAVSAEEATGQLGPTQTPIKRRTADGLTAKETDSIRKRNS